MAPTDFLQAILNLYSRPQVPTLSLSNAVLLSLLYTITYVGILYLHPSTRPSTHLSRDAPSVIRARVRAVYTSCIITTFTSFFVVRSYGGKNVFETLHLMGIWPISLYDIARGLWLTVVLFAGPVVERVWFEGGWKEIKSGEAWGQMGGWVAWRNYVVGPITEEITFRTGILSLHLITPKPHITTLIFMTPLYFGIAHLHHFYEFLVTHPDSFGMGIARSIIQFAFTTVFGWYASWLYLRFGSLWVVIVVHSFCNVMGLPRFYGKVGDGVKWKSSVYYALLILGVWGFWVGLWRWTESSNALVAFPTIKKQ